MYQPSRKPVARGVIEILPVDLLTSGTGTFTFRLDSSSGRIVARHSGLGIDSIGYLVAQVELPEDFDRFEKDAVKIIVRRSGAVDSLTATLSKDAVADATINGSNVVAINDLTYETKLLTPGTVYARRDILILQFISTCDPLESNDIASIELTYHRRP